MISGWYLQNCEAEGESYVSSLFRESISSGPHPLHKHTMFLGTLQVGIWLYQRAVLPDIHLHAGILA